MTLSIFRVLPSFHHISPIPQPITLIVGSSKSPCSALSFDIHIIFIGPPDHTLSLFFLSFFCDLLSTLQLPLPFTIHYLSIIPQPIHHPSLPPYPPFKPWISITIIITILCYVYQDLWAYWVRWELDQAVAVSGVS